MRKNKWKWSTSLPFNPVESSGLTRGRHWPSWAQWPPGGTKVFPQPSSATWFGLKSVSVLLLFLGLCLSYLECHQVQNTLGLVLGTGRADVRQLVWLLSDTQLLRSMVQIFPMTYSHRGQGLWGTAKLLHFLTPWAQAPGGENFILHGESSGRVHGAWKEPFHLHQIF